MEGVERFFFAVLAAALVVNAHLNELLVKCSVYVSEGQDKLPTMYWLPKLHKS